MTYPIFGEKTIYRLFTISFLLLAMVPTTTLHSQVYMKNLGTRGLELSMEMTATSDGNYVTVGPVTRPPNAPPGLDIYLNKVDPGGNLIWTQRIVEMNGQGAGSAFPFSVTETFFSDGTSSGYAVTGIVRNGLTIDDPIMVVTTDTFGIPSGYNSYGGALPINNLGVISGRGSQIIQIPDGRLAVCGSVWISDYIGLLPFILVVQQDLSLDFMRVYEDARFAIPGANLFGFDTRAHFADIEYIEAGTTANGVTYEEGFVVVGTTGKMGDWFSEIIVMRTKINGNPIHVALHGPQQTPSRGTALTVTNAGNIQVAGLVMNLPPATGGPTPPPSTLVLKLDPFFLGLLDQDQYYGFITYGDIRQITNDEFILAGRDPFAPDAAVLRIKVNGTVIFANGYGGPNVEVFTDVHEMAGGDLLASGVTTTWCRGPVDEYLTRTLFDGSVVGCNFYPLNVDPAEPNYTVRDTGLPSVLLTLVNEHDKDIPTPNTIVRLICPLLIVLPPMPWDWFIRADFTRDLQVDIGDAIASLGRLFGGGQASIPAQAADSNGDGAHDVSDVIHTLAYLFGGGAPPSTPFTQPGPDPSTDQGNVFNMGELFQFVDQAMFVEGGVFADQ